MKFVYSFDEGNKSMKPLLGGKGANLAEMTFIGLPIPPGFTITTEACAYYSEHNQFPEEKKENHKLPNGMMEEVEEHLAKLEKRMNMKLGDHSDPLLVSVRSGAAASMPGMMDTVLNLGLNDTSVEGIAKKTNNSRFAYDSYRRFIQMFSDVVLGVDINNFENALEKAKQTKGVENDTGLDAEDLKKLVAVYKNIVKEKLCKEFPQEPKEQLRLAIAAVFGSWNNDRAKAYRRINNITGLKGTAVNIQSMVFGNMGDDSGTGVCFTRNPSTGENKFYGEYLMNAQGEDVVAGIRTPLSIEKLEKNDSNAYKQLCEIRLKLEKHFRDMQDIEFTIQKGSLFILQTRDGKRTAKASVKIAVDMNQEGLITEKDAVLRVNPNQLDQLLHKQLDPLGKQKAKVLATGLPASPGAGVGRIVFNAEDAKKFSEKGQKIILCRTETSPEDIEGMNVAIGILTSRGGMTSHAAVVARGMGKCCVAGCGDAKIDEYAKTLKIADKSFKEMDWITLDGNTGEVFGGMIPTIDPEISCEFALFMSWADKYRKLGVRTNADTPHDAKKAREFGAEGIGLCRTEHMFFEGERILAVREMILSNTKQEREKALAKILPMQKQDFIGIFRVMKGLPVTIRLLDPPLHEFLPKEEKDIIEIAKDMNIDIIKLKQKIEDLHEQNPMLGHRGCRLIITYPEITEMQTRAIIEAAIEVSKEQKDGKFLKVIPEIMIPLVGDVNELKLLKKEIKQIADEIIREGKIKLEYKIGTMIEVPRACLVADKIAEEAEFFSFGTNDLTQMTFGFSRDDIAKFLPEYLAKNILPRDPFQAIDQEGIGELIKMAVSKGREKKKDLKIGICGEHGGEPSSVEFCHRNGLNYVSCSPFRVPIARLAAAQAALRN